ncbi:hypothetical protein [Geobacter sp. DSM 9736]|uniref:hypothetical protein n=1 Tax=Geobacter sp. DSM 9736 TaxID=1277350 RepID=UPI000B50EFF2|nr:hypothetical protein [Geobacter sp. DSM 9736]SNB45836.1 hypothetical protein SAMN06269301_1265 [Geobacter sp. DSM 9736]
MFSVLSVTFRGVLRDRVFHGILMTAVVFLGIPSVSSLSMRQVTELSLTLALSLVSFILLLLSIFLGGTSLWKDMERRYTFSVLGLPISRSSYLLGRFSGVALFILVATIVLGAACCVVVWYVSSVYPPDRPIVWTNILLSLLFDSFKYILLVSFAFLFSTVSTSFFLPVFGAISIFLVGSATQEAYDFIHTPTGQSLPAIIKALATILYYLLPNFAAFDLKVNAIYAVKVSPSGLLLTTLYFCVYTAIILLLSSALFSRRELV